MFSCRHSNLFPFSLPSPPLQNPPTIHTLSLQSPDSAPQSKVQTYPNRIAPRNSFLPNKQVDPWPTKAQAARCNSLRRRVFPPGTRAYTSCPPRAPSGSSLRSVREFPSAVLARFSHPRPSTQSPARPISPPRPIHPNPPSGPSQRFPGTAPATRHPRTFALFRSPSAPHSSSSSELLKTRVAPLLVVPEEIRKKSARRPSPSIRTKTVCLFLSQARKVRDTRARRDLCSQKLRAPRSPVRILNGRLPAALFALQASSLQKARPFLCVPAIRAHSL